MKQTKFLSLLLAFAILFAVQIPICAAGTSATLTAKQSEAAERNGPLEICLDAGEAVLGGSFQLVYDPSVMEYQSISSADYTCQVNAEYAKNQIRVTFASSTGISKGTAFSFYFRPLVTDSCTTSFSFEDVNLYNAAGESIEAVATGATYEVTVTKEITDVQLSATELVLGVGEQTQMSYHLTPSDATVESVTWYSYNTRIASIDDNGIITANREGAVNMRCTVTDCFGRTYQRSFTVTVYNKPNISISSGYFSANERFTVAVRLDTVGAVYTSGSMNLVYDPTVLSLESAQVGKLLNGCMTTVNPNYGEDTVRLNFLGQQGISGSGEICVLTFTALQAGETQIHAEQVLLYKNDNMEHSANTGTGNVGIGDYGLSMNAPAEAEAWKEFRTSVTFAAAPGVAGGSFVVTYDAEQFRYMGYSDVLTGFAVTVNDAYAPGKIKVSFAGTQGVSEGTLMTLRFVSKENPEGGIAAEIGFEESTVTLYTQSGTKIQPKVSGADFTVAYNEMPFRPGDADSNGVMDTRDATTLLRYLSGEADTGLVDSLADLNGDGEVTEDDMRYLMKLLAGWDPSEIT